MTLPQIDLRTYPEHARGPWKRGEGNGGCWLCGHANVGQNPKMLTVEAGTFTCVDPALVTEETLGSSIYLQPIGATCLKKHPELKPYVYEAPDA